MKVLVAYEDKYRFYRQVIARAIGNLRPQLEVRCARLEKLERELVLFDPHVVVSSQANDVDRGSRTAWVELPVEPSYPADIRLAGDRTKTENPTLADVLSVLDEAEERLREDRPRDGC